MDIRYYFRYWLVKSNFPKRGLPAHAFSYSFISPPRHLSTVYFFVIRFSNYILLILLKLQVTAGVLGINTSAAARQTPNSEAGEQPPPYNIAIKHNNNDVVFSTV